MRELQRELASLRTASQRQTSTYERALYDCGRYRPERDRLQSARAAPVSGGGLSAVALVPHERHDPYAHYGSVPTEPYGSAVSEDASRGSGRLPASRCPALKSCPRRSLVIWGIVPLPPTSRGLLYPSMAQAIKRGASSPACINRCCRYEVPLPRRAMRVPLSLPTRCRSKGCTTCDRPSRLVHLRT